jgi:hypothetical protein
MGKYVAVLVVQSVEDGDVGWYIQHEKYRDVDDFALWFCNWNTVKGQTTLELFDLPNRGVDKELDRDLDRNKTGRLEQYKVWSKPLDPAITVLRKEMQAKIDAFGELFATFVKEQPADHYGIVTLGHGDPNFVMGDMFETNYGRALFTKIREALGGKNLTFVDSMTLCNAGSYANLEAMAIGVDYYLASALKAGGIGTKVEDRAAGQKMVEAIRLKADENYSKAFENKPDKDGNARTIKGCLIKLALMQQSYWAKCAEYKDVIDMISKNNMEDVAIYDCSKVEALRQALGWNSFNDRLTVSGFLNGAPPPTDNNCYAEGTSKFVDMQSYVLGHKPTAKDALDKVMVYYTSNEQFGVDWSKGNKGTSATTTSHGLLINRASFLGIK